MGSTVAQLRRTLAQRMNFWGGNISNNGAATFTANGTANTAVDTLRTEPDDIWASSWIVLNPGSTDQAGSPTIWRQIASDGGWSNNTGAGTFTIVGTWPTPYTNGSNLSGVTYELYKVFRPEHWLQAINYSIAESYPQRHRAVQFEVPQDYVNRILDYTALGKEVTSITNPTTAPTLTEIANGQGAFSAGTWKIAYTYYNDYGETLQSNVGSIVIAGTNSQIQISNLTSVPSSVVGANFYCSMQPGDTALDMLDWGQMSTPSPPTTTTGAPYQPGWNFNGTIYALIVSSPNPFYGMAPPSYNTTSVDFLQLHYILQRINPGSFPPIWNDLGNALWKPLGGTKIMLMYFPVQQFNLMMICSTANPSLSAESDSTAEPSEMIYWGAEKYLWDLLLKTSNIVNVPWQKLRDTAEQQFELFKNKYALPVPRERLITPLVRVQY